MAQKNKDSSTPTTSLPYRTWAKRVFFVMSAVILVQTFLWAVIIIVYSQVLDRHFFAEHASLFRNEGMRIMTVGVVQFAIGYLVVKEKLLALVAYTALYLFVVSQTAWTEVVTILEVQLFQSITAFEMVDRTIAATTVTSWAISLVMAVVLGWFWLDLLRQRQGQGSRA